MTDRTVHAQQSSESNALPLLYSHCSLLFSFLFSYTSQGKISKPEFRVLRGTALTERGSLHSGLWHAIAGDVKEPVDIERALSRKLIRPKKSTKRSWMIVVVVDEIDQLMYHNHDVLRKLFEWADAPKSRLVRNSCLRVIPGYAIKYHPYSDFSIEKKCSFSCGVQPRSCRRMIRFLE